MRRLVFLGAILVLAGCAEPAEPVRQPAEEPPAVQPVVVAQSDAITRADALIAEMRRNEASFARMERESARPVAVNPIPVVTEAPPPRMAPAVRVAPVEATAYAPPIERRQGGLEILSSSYAVTEQNRVWWRYSWKMTIRNQERVPVSVTATMEFKDSRGYILDTDTERLVIDGSAITDVSGFALVSLGPAERVSQASAVARILR